MAFAPECFFGLPSAGFSPGRNFAEFKKMRAEGVLAKFAIAPLYEHFGSRGLLQIGVLCLHFKCILIRRQWHLRQDVFSGLLSAGISTSRKFAEFQKMRAEGVLAKFAIARFYGHLGSRSLLQNVVLCWHFKTFLSGDNDICARVFFLAFFLQVFPLVATLQNFRKWPLRVFLPNLP